MRSARASNSVISPRASRMRSFSWRAMISSIDYETVISDRIRQLERNEREHTAGTPPRAKAEAPKARTVAKMAAEKRIVIEFGWLVGVE